jgi:hypothetical protein
VEKSVYDSITDRIDQECVPFLNDEGQLEIPYLGSAEMAVEASNINHTNNNSAIMLPPTMSRRDSSNFTAATNINMSN